MDRTQQREIATEIADGFKKTFLQKIERIPEEWTGFEIRQYASDLMAELYVVAMDSQRMKAYKNEVLTRNL